MFSPLFKFAVLSLIFSLGALSKPAPGPIATESLSSRKTGQYYGRATRFLQKGNAGACGHFHSDNDHIVALETTKYAYGTHCGKTISITDLNTGAVATAVVADECPTCGATNNIDLSEALFESFAAASVGVLPVVWEFV